MHWRHKQQSTMQTPWAKRTCLCRIKLTFVIDVVLCTSTRIWYLKKDIKLMSPLLRFPSKWKCHIHMHTQIRCHDATTCGGRRTRTWKFEVELLKLCQTHIVEEATHSIVEHRYSHHLIYENIWIMENSSNSQFTYKNTRNIISTRTKC